MAAGLGTRMQSRRAKHLHPLLGRRLVDWLIAPVRRARARSARGRRVARVAEELEGTLPAGADLAVQEEPRGTGDAAAAAQPALEGFEGDVLVLAGDAPLLTGTSSASLVATHRRERRAVTVLSFEPEEPVAYGRVVRDGDGRLRAIVEARDATAGGARDPRGQLLHLRLSRGRPLERALDGLDARQRAGGALPHRRGAALGG